jgi:hypothetical protein
MNGILTVGELKEILSKQPDDTQIVVAVDDYYQNISAVIEPDNDSYFAITFEIEDTFDPRQF